MEILFLLFAAVVAFLVILLLFPSGQKSDIRDRLADLDEEPFQTQQSVQEAELQKPFVERVIRPILSRLAGKDKQKLKAKKKDKSLKKELARAGFPGGLTPAEYSVIQTLFKLMCPGLAVSFSILFAPDVILLASVGGVIAGILIPSYYLKAKITNRMATIQKQLPDVLDLLTVAVEAGLGFDAACDKVVEKMAGPIPEEFSLTLRHMRMGQARRDAFKSMADRLDQPDLNSFISAIIQADQLGVSIGQVLRIQSDQLRQKRRQRAEEEAAKAPVKMMIPLVLFIFPNVGIVIGCPAIFQIIEELSRSGL